MFEDTCSTRDKMSQSLCTFQDSMNNIQNSLKSTKIRQKGLEKIIDQQSIDINQLQNQCEIQNHFLETIPQERQNAYQTYNKVSFTLNELQKKQLNINDLIDKSMKMYDFICISVNLVQNDFKDKILIIQNNNTLYQKDIQDVKNLGNSTYEMLKMNLQEKQQVYKQLKNLYDQSDLLYKRKDLNIQLTQLETQNNQILINKENTTKLLNNLNENMFKLKNEEDNLKLKLNQINIDFDTKLNELNYIFDLKMKEINDINKRLNEQIISINYINNTKENINQKYNIENKLLSSLQNEYNNYLNQINMYNQRTNDLSKIKNNLEHKNQILIETKKRIINLKQEYDKNDQNLISLNHEISIFDQKIQENHNQIEIYKQKLANNEQSKLNDYLFKLKNNMQEMYLIKKEKIKFKNNHENDLKKSICGINNSLIGIKEKKLSRLNYSKKLQNNIINMELMIKDKKDVMNQLEIESSNTLIESEMTECFKYDIDMYYDLLNKGIEEIECIKNQQKEAIYIDKMLKNKKNLMEDIQKTFKTSLKVKMEEFQELKIKTKHQVERQKELLSAAQYDYCMAKNELSDERRTEAELKAIIDVLSFDITIFKQLMNWVKPECTIDKSLSQKTQNTQELSQKHISTPKSSQLMQKSSQLMQKSLKLKKKIIEDVPIVSSATGDDMDIDLDFGQIASSIKSTYQEPIDMDIDIPSLDKSQSGLQKIFGMDHLKKMKEKKTKKVRFNKKQHDQVNSLIDLLKDDK